MNNLTNRTRGDRVSYNGAHGIVGHGNRRYNTCTVTFGTGAVKTDVSWWDLCATGERAYHMRSPYALVADRHSDKLQVWYAPREMPPQQIPAHTHYRSALDPHALRSRT